MKKTVKKEVSICDECGKQGCLHECMICGKDYCYECFKVIGIKFSHSVRCSGSGDGEYCAECVEKNSSDELIIAYQAIQSLRDECDAYYLQFDKRADAAKERVSLLFKARGSQ